MTTFQLICAAIFGVTLVVAYKQQLVALLRGVTANVSVSGPQNSIAVPLVDDIMAVTKLRDKLAAEDCRAGVEACTALLRVIVEYEQPSKGAA